MRGLALCIAGAALVVLTALAPLTATASPTSASAFEPSIPLVDSFESAAEELPPGLQEAVVRDLGISPAEYLQQAEAAAVASTTVPELVAAGVAPDDIWLDGDSLHVHADDPALEELATGLGAVVSDAPAPEPRQDLEQPVEAYDELIGGRGWRSTTGDGISVICSTGFTGFDATGARTMGTAGHCFDGQVLPGTARLYDQSAPDRAGTTGALIGPLSPARFHFGGGDDVGFVTVSNTQLTSRGAVSTWDGGSIAVRGAITATTGAAICKSGRTTGWTCGRVLATNRSISVEGRTVNSIVTDLCMYRGDSGGPALIGNYAAGINSSGTWSSAACTNGGYANVYPVQGHADSATQQAEGWEVAVVLDVPIVDDAVGGADASIHGTVPNAAPGTTVLLFLDGAAAPAASADVAPDGSWSFEAGALPTSGSHPFAVVAGYGTWNRSAAASGVLRPPIDVSRLHGATRYETAVEISEQAYPDGSAVAYLATGTNFPDALVAAPGAVAHGGPLLLTQPDLLPGAVESELRRLGATRVVIVGGPASVTTSVETRLRSIVGDVERIAGADRYATARQFVDRTFPDPVDALYLATGENFPDALSASAVAGAEGAPVLTVPGGAPGLDAATRASILALAPARIRIAGGVNVVSAGIEADLRALVPDTVRVSGADRYETAARVAASATGADGALVYLATGTDFPDALAGAALAGKEGHPLVLSAPDCLPAPAITELDGWGTDRVTLLGGPATLSANVAALKPC